MKGISVPPFILKAKKFSFTRDLTLTSGSQQVTGIGFKPKIVLFFAARNATAYASFGCDDAAAPGCVYTGGGNYYPDSGAASIYHYVSGSEYAYGKVSSMDVDGFTVQWAQVAGTGTLTVNGIALG